MNLFKVLSLITVFTFFGCQEEETAFGDDYCRRIDLDQDGSAWLEGLKVNGDPLPFYSFYEYDDNYSEVMEIILLK